MPATPPPGATRTTLQVGTYDAVTDTFTMVLDLNDGASYRIHPRGLDIRQPDKTVARAGNLRTPGQAVPAWQYGNRHITVEVGITSTVSAADLVSRVHALQAAIEQPPYVLRLALPGASAYSYADVLAVTARIPTDTQLINARGLPRVQLDFECAPGLRGDRVILDNLVANPGFEQPAGPGVNVFSDTFANANPYSALAGGAPTVGAVNGTYVDMVMSDAPLRYYRLDEASGTTANDISGNGRHGTLAGGVALGTAGMVAGDSDAAMTFNGTTSTISLPTVGLPTGNAPWSLECIFKCTALPPASTNAKIVCFGVTGNNQSGQIYVRNNAGTGELWMGTGGASNDVKTGTIALNTVYHAVVTWDGATLRGYQNAGAAVTLALAGVSVGTTAAYIGVALPGNTEYFAGVVDEVAIYGTALAAARVAAHYNALSAGTGLGTIANVLTVAAGGRVAFGSPVWGPINTWQVRFRYTAALSPANFYAHYVDANNALRARVDGTTLQLVHTVAGAVTNPAPTPISLANNAWYWLSVTQFPAQPGTPPKVVYTLVNDVNGAPSGAVVGSLAAFAASDTVAVTGRPAIEANGAALQVGGPYPNVHRVFLFGPGGWAFQDNTAGGQSAWASGAWETDYGAGAVAPALVTYPGGPVASAGAARIEAPAAGTWDAYWRTYAGGTTAGTVASPVGAAGNTLGVYAWVRSSGLSAGAVLRLRVVEFDAAGNQLRIGSAGADLVGNQPGWTRIGGAYVTGANCAYVGVLCRALDTSAPGASANATVWFDNVQCWDATDLGCAATDGAMPYCELRFPASPAQLVVSGLRGEMPAPAFAALGTYYAGTLSAGQALPFVLARRRRAGSTARLIGGATSGFLQALDATAWGGCYAQTSNTGANVVQGFLPPNTGDAYGAYHLYARLWSSETVFSRQTLQPVVRQVGATSPWSYYTSAPGALVSSPFRASSLWSVLDAGQVRYPPAAGGVLADPAVYPLRTQLATTDTASRTERANWHALIPIDGDVLVGQVSAPAGLLGALSAQYLWLYVDGLGVARGGAAGTTLSVSGVGGAGAQAAPSRGLNAQGLQSGTSIDPSTLWYTATLGADPYLTLDPTVTVPSGPGAGQAVNQLVAQISDASGTVLPVALQLRYSPLYLYPRP